MQSSLMCKVVNYSTRFALKPPERMAMKSKTVLVFIIVVVFIISSSVFVIFKFMDAHLRPFYDLIFNISEYFPSACGGSELFTVNKNDVKAYFYWLVFGEKMNRCSSSLGHPYLVHSWQRCICVCVRLIQSMNILLCKLSDHRTCSCAFHRWHFSSLLID